MPIVSYTYTSSDFLSATQVDTGALQTTIAASSISSASIVSIETAGVYPSEVFSIWFSGTLSGPDQTTLTGIVNSYTYTTTVETTVSNTSSSVLYNKSLLTNTNFFIDNTDNTKKIAFSCAGNTSGITATFATNCTTAKTISFPDITDTVVTLVAVQTLTNKTLTTLNVNGPGSGTLGSNTFYVSPSSTAFSGSGNYFYNYFAAPTTTGSTTGSAYNIYIAGAPTAAANNFSLYVASGKTYLSGGLQIPTGAALNYVLTSDASGNASWASPSSVGVSFPDGTASSPGIYFTSESGTGFYRPGAGQIGVELSGTNYVTFSTTNNTFSNRITISATTNQFVLGTTNTITITAPAPSASRTYTIPDAGGAANFLLSVGNQTISGINTFSNTTAATSSTVGGIVISGGAAIAKNMWIGTSFSGTVNTTNGNIFNIPSVTFTDNSTAASGTAATNNIWALLQPTISATNTSVTTTRAASAYFGGAPIKGTNQTFTNVYGIYIDSVSTTSATVVEAASLLIAAAPTVTSGTTYALKIAAGNSIFGGLLTASNGFTLTTGALNITSTSGAISLTGTTFSTNTQVQITATTNQLVLGTTNTLTITSPAPAASRTYTIPDAGGAANFILSTFGSTQTIAGGLTSSGLLTASNGFTLTTGALNLTSTSGAISLTGTTFSTNTQIQVTATTNQLVLGTTNTITITAPAPAASRTYTIPDAGGAANFLLSAGNQTLSGVITFSNTTAATSSTAGAIIISGGLAIAKNIWIGTSFSNTINGLNGNVFNIPAITFTDSSTAASGTAATNNILSLVQPTIAATNTAVTTTRAASAYFGGAPIKGTNQTFTNVYGVYIDSAATTNATVTSGASLYIVNAPTVTSGTVYALQVAAGNSIFGGLLTASNGFTLTTGALNLTSTSGAISLTGTTFSTNTQVQITATTNQLVLGTTNTLTISSIAPAASRTYTIPDAGGAANFILSTFGSTQTIAGGLTSSGLLTASNGFTLTTGALNLTSTSGAISLTGTTFSTNTQVQITATTNQLVLGTTNTLTITSPAPAASRTYTIPDAGGAANFILSTFGSTQTIAGGLTSSGLLTASNGFTLTTGALNLTSTSGAISLTGTTFSTNTQVQITATTNQLVLGTTNTLTITSPAPAASRTYTIPDAGGAANFILSTSTGGQTIAGGITSSGLTSITGPGTTTTGNWYNNPTAVNNPAASAYYWSYYATPPAFTGTGVTIPNAYTLYIQNAPQAGTSTITNAYALYVAAGTSAFAGLCNLLGTNAATSSTSANFTNAGGASISKNLWLGTSFLGTVNGLNGNVFNIPVITFTDNSTASSGTASSNIISSIIQPTIAATNTSVTTTLVATSYLGGAPIKGTNQTFTNLYGLYIDSAATTSATVTEAASLYILNAPTVVSGTTYAIKANAGKVYIGGTLQIPTGSANGYILSSDASGNASWISPGSAAVSFGDGTSALPSIYFTAQPGTGFYRPGSGQIGVELAGTNYVTFTTTGTTFTQPITISATTNQLVLGAVSANITITAPVPSASRIYTIPDAGSAASFILSTSASGQTIAGGLTSSSTFTASNGITMTTGTLNLTSTSGTISLAGTSFSTNTQMQVTATTNQFILGTTNTVTITAPAPVASRTYTIPDAGGAASFIMSTSTGGQTIAGGLTSSGLMSITGPGTTTTGNWYNNPTAVNNPSASAYYWTYYATPPAFTGTGVTIPNAYTIYVQNAPQAGTSTITNAYALYIAAGKTYIGGSLQIPTGASSGYLLTSDASGNATWSVATTTITNYQVLANSTISTTSTTLSNITSMTLTPSVAGTYLITFSTNFRVSNANRTGTFDLALNGTQITNTQSALTIASANSDVPLVITTTIVLNGTTDTVTARYSISANTLTLQDYRRIGAMRLSS